MGRISAFIWTARVGGRRLLRIRGTRTPDPHGEADAGDGVCGVKKITTTPIPKLDMDGLGSNRPYRTPLARIPRVDEHHCVGCNLCSLVCPVPECITMERVETDLRAGKTGGEGYCF